MGTFGEADPDGEPPVAPRLGVGEVDFPADVEEEQEFPAMTWSA